MEDDLPAVERIIRDASDIFRDKKERDQFLRRLGRACRKTQATSTPEEFIADATNTHTELDDFPYAIERLAPLAETSVTAFGLLKSQLSAERGKDALDRGDIETAVRACAAAYRKHSMVVRWEARDVGLTMEAFRTLSTDASKDTKVRADALLVVAHLLFVQGKIPQGLRQVHLAQRLEPRDADLYSTEGCILAMLLQQRAALTAYTRASTLGCTDSEHNLFHRAVLMDMLSVDDKRSTPLLEEFVASAEPDARKLPEACYRLVMLHGIRGPNHLGAARRYNDLGLKADEARLPIFGDETVHQRAQARALVRRYHACGNPTCDALGCRLCSSCKMVRYCSRECQVQDWRRQHESTCKQHTKK